MSRNGEARKDKKNHRSGRKGIGSLSTTTGLREIL